MKLTLGLVGALVMATATRAHADARGDAAIAAARTWYGGMLAQDGSVPAPSKSKPVHYLMPGDLASCASVKAGKATSAAVLKKVGACLAAVQKEMADDAPPHMWEVTIIDVVEVGFAKRHHKNIEAAAKGATLVNAVLEGNAADIYMAVAPDGTIRGVWVSQNAPG